MPHARNFNPEMEQARQRRENVRDTEQRTVMMGDGRGRDPAVNLYVRNADGTTSQRLWVRDIGGEGIPGYTGGGSPYQVLPGVGPTPAFDKHVILEWQPALNEWRVHMSDPDYMDAVGQSMHLENPSDPSNQFHRTEQLLPLRSQLIGDGKASVQGYQYTYKGVYYDYKGTDEDVHPDILAEAPGADEQRYVLLAYNYDLYNAPGDNPIEIFVSTPIDAIADTLDHADINECVAQVDLTTSELICAYRVSGDDVELYGHRDDRDLRGWLNTPILSVAAPRDAKYLVQQAHTGLPNAQAMGALGTGLIKNTTTTGVQSIAVAGTDYTSPLGIENLANKTITASSINSTPIGASSPNTGAFTTLSALVTDAATNTTTNAFTIGHDTSGTPAAGFGTGLLFQGESSTTPAQDMGRMRALWTTATHASRASNLVLSTWNVSAEVDVLTLTPTGIEVNGNVRAGTTGSALSAARLVVNQAASGVGHLIRINATTPGNALEIRNSSAGLITSFDSGGRLGIGVAPLTTRGVYSSLGTLTATTTGSYGSVEGEMTPAPTANTSATYHGVIGTANLAGSSAINATGRISAFEALAFNTNSNGSSVISDLRGFYAAAYNAGAAAVTSVYGVNVRYGLSGTGSVTNAIGVLCDPFDAGAGVITNAYGLKVNPVNVGGTLNYAIYTEAGLVRLGDSMTVAGSVTATGVGSFIASNAATNALVTVMTLGVNSTGTAAAGFGPSVLLQGESSTTNDTAMATIDALWDVATHASRASALTLNVYSTTTKQQGLKIVGDASGIKIGLNGATPVARQTYGAPTGAVTRSTFDPSTVTLSELGERVAAIITDLRSRGDFG